MTKRKSGIWRCFHCDQVFKSFETAKRHFGLENLDVPACVEKISLRDAKLVDEAKRYRMRALFAEAMVTELQKALEKSLADNEHLLRMMGSSLRRR